MSPATLKKINRKLDSVTTYVRHDSLKPAPWNPAIRIDPNYLRKLRQSMERDGFWEYAPVLVDPDGTIIDGHRRWAVAGVLHIKELPVTIVDAPADKVWAEYNGTRATVTPAQMLQAVAGGIKHIPANVQLHVTHLEEVIGKEGIKRLAENATSPAIYAKMRHIAKYCGKSDDIAWQKKCIFWMMDNKGMNGIASRAIKDGIAPAVIVKAVNEGRPLAINWSTR